MATETILLDGHIIDSLLLPKVLDLIGSGGGTHVIERIQIGHTRDEPSQAVVRVSASDEAALESILETVQQHGAIRTGGGDARLAPAERDGILPDDFYVTTSRDTRVRVGGRWLPVRPAERFCAIRVAEGEAHAVPPARVRAGDPIVVGYNGVQVAPLERPRPDDPRAPGPSDLWTETPRAAAIARIADLIRAARAAGQGILMAGGPALVQTGAGPHLERLIRAGFVSLLFGDSALAWRDLAGAAAPGGTPASAGLPAEPPQEAGLRLLNRVRRAGGLREAAAQGWLRGGVLQACLETGIPFVLAGRVDDPAPLPGVLSDSQAAQQAMREAIQAQQIGVCLLVATASLGRAAAGLLPARVTTVAVDLRADSAARLLEHDSFGSLGLVTDCEWFLKELADRLTSEKKVSPARAGAKIL